MKKLILAVACASMATPALGVPDNDFGVINLDPNNNIGLGCIGMDTAWLEYPQVEEASWWNTWAYDGQLDLERWKRIEYVADANSVGVAGKYYVEIALNWSTADYPTNLGYPPRPGKDEAYIEREVVFADTVDLFGPSPVVRLVASKFDILEYNPEWVSADVRVDPTIWSNPGNILVQVDLWHECLPEPTMLGLLALGGCLLRLRRRSCPTDR